MRCDAGAAMDVYIGRALIVQKGRERCARTMEQGSGLGTMDRTLNEQRTALVP